MGGIEGLFSGLSPTGTAKTKTGEDIRYKDIEVEKLTSTMNRAMPSSNSSISVGDENENVAVHDGGKSPRLWGLPTTDMVRSSRRPQPMATSNIDLYQGLSSQLSGGSALKTPIGGSPISSNLPSSLKSSATPNVLGADDISAIGAIRSQSKEKKSSVGQII